MSTDKKRQRQPLLRANGAHARQIMRQVLAREAGSYSLRKQVPAGRSTRTAAQPT
jgi:hypothetical protein